VFFKKGVLKVAHFSHFPIKQLQVIFRSETKAHYKESKILLMIGYKQMALDAN